MHWRRLPAVVGGGVALAALDQLFKLLIVAQRDRLPVDVIPGCFRLVYVENTGVAFGMLANAGSVLWLVSGLGCLAVLVLLASELQRPRPNAWMLTALALVLGGALGNLLDRARLGYVVDYVDWYLRVGTETWHWYAFNLADAGICVGVALLVGTTLLDSRAAETACEPRADGDG